MDGDSYDWIANGLRLAGADVRYSGRSPLLPLVNRVLVTVVLVMSHVPFRAMLGTLHDNLIELATLCLGGGDAVALSVSRVN